MKPIEAVARALFLKQAQQEGFSPVWEDHPQQYRDGWMDQARAAILALEDNVNGNSVGAFIHRHGTIKENIAAAIRSAADE